MARMLVIAAASAAVFALSTYAFAQQTGGTADEAKAMLMKAVAAVKADKAKAIDCSTMAKAGSATGTFTYSAKMSAMARSSRLATLTPSS